MHIYMVCHIVDCSYLIRLQNNEHSKQDFKAEEILVVYDPDFKYGQNFFTFVTNELKEGYLAYLDALKAQEQKGENVIFSK